MLYENSLYELSQEFKNEIEVLENSYVFAEGEEATIVFYETHTELFLRLTILEVEDEEGDGEEEEGTAQIKLHVRFPKTYPLKTPQLKILPEGTKGLTKKQQRELEEICANKMKNELEGDLVVHDVVLICQDYLREKKFTAQEYLSLRKRLENKMKKVKLQERHNQEKARYLNEQSVQSKIKPSETGLDQDFDSDDSSEQDSDEFFESEEGEDISDDDDGTIEDEEDEEEDGISGGGRKKGGWFRDEDSEEEEEEEGEEEEEDEISSYDENSLERDVMKIGSGVTPTLWENGIPISSSSSISSADKKRLEKLQCFFINLLEKYVVGSNISSTITKSLRRNKKKNEDNDNDNTSTTTTTTPEGLLKKMINHLKSAGVFPQGMKLEEERGIFQSLFKPHIQLFEKRLKKIDDMSLEYQSPLTPSASKTSLEEEEEEEDGNSAFPPRVTTSTQQQNGPPFPTGIDWEIEKILWEKINNNSKNNNNNRFNNNNKSSSDEGMIRRSPSSELSNENMVSYETQSRYMSDFEFIKIIGRGGFGEVVLARNIYDKRKYAIKKIVFSKDDAKEKLMTKREVSLLSQLVHENVVRYYNCWMEDYHEDKVRDYSFKSNRFDNILFIQMEYCETTLDRLIRKRILYNSNHRSVIWESVRQLLEGLQYLHERDIIHRDLKPSNLFVNIIKEPSSSSNNNNTDNNPPKMRYIMKIGDFGLARRGAKKKNRKVSQIQNDDIIIINNKKEEDINNITEKSLNSSSSSSSNSDNSYSFNSSSLTHNIGTLTYTAPEVLKKEKYGTKIDLYALGITFFEMCLKFDSRHERGKLLTDLRRTGKIHCPYWPNSWERERELIESLVVHNPLSRPSAYELLHSGILPMDLTSQKTFLSQVFTQEPEVDVDGLAQEEQNSINTYICYYKESVLNCFVRVSQQHGATHVPISMILPHSFQTKRIEDEKKEKFQKILFQQNNISSSFNNNNNNNNNNIKVHCLPSDLSTPLIRDLSRRPGIRGKGMLKRYSSGDIYKINHQSSIISEEWFVYESISAVNSRPQGGLLESEVCKVILTMADCIKPRQDGKWVLRINHFSFFQQLLEKCVIPTRLHQHMAKLFEFRLQQGMTWQVFYQLLRFHNVGFINNNNNINNDDDNNNISSSNLSTTFISKTASLFQLGFSEKHVQAIEFYTNTFFSSRDPYESLLFLEKYLRSGQYESKKALEDFSQLFRFLEHYGVMESTGSSISSISSSNKNNNKKSSVKIILDPFFVPPHNLFKRYEGGIVFSLDINFLRKKKKSKYRSRGLLLSSSSSSSSSSLSSSSSSFSFSSSSSSTSYLQVGYGGTINKYINNFLPVIKNYNNNNNQQQKKNYHHPLERIICGMNFCMDRIYDNTNLRVKCLGGKMRPFLHGIPQIMIFIKEGGMITTNKTSYSSSSTTTATTTIKKKKKRGTYPWVEMGMELASFLWKEGSWKTDFFYENSGYVPTTTQNTSKKKSSSSSSAIGGGGGGLSDLISYCAHLQIEWILVLRRNRNNNNNNNRNISYHHRQVFNILDMKVQVFQIKDFKKIQKNRYQYSRRKGKGINEKKIFVRELPVYLESGGKTTKPFGGGDNDQNNNNEISSSSHHHHQDSSSSSSSSSINAVKITPKNIKNITFASCGIKPKYSFQKDLLMKAKMSFEELYGGFLKINQGIKIVVVLELSKGEIQKAIHVYKTDNIDKFLLNQKHHGTFRNFFKDLKRWKKNPIIVFVCLYSVESSTSILVELR